MNKLGELQDVCWHSFLIVNIPRHVPSQFDGCRSVFCTAAAPRHLTKVSSVRLHAFIGHVDVTACRPCVSQNDGVSHSRCACISQEVWLHHVWRPCHPPPCMTCAGGCSCCCKARAVSVTIIM
jgi:hypothetical protein